MSDKPYVGLHRKLVLGIDVGTTFSGISFAILDPGKPVEIKSVTRFPAQEQVGADSKTPSIILYDKNGQPKAFGAEALEEQMVEMCEEEDWLRLEWFKLHMRPNSGQSANISAALSPLPRNRSIIQVLADYLKYLFKCAHDYIVETSANGTALWNSVEPHIEYVLTHPNGWTGAQQGQILQAAILAGYIPDKTSEHHRIQFVTEGEASLHFCIQNGLTQRATKHGEGILVIDAGGGTIDSNAYCISKDNPDGPECFEEIGTPRCHFKGSVFVTNQARGHIHDKLKGSSFANDLDHIVRCFDKTTKLRFRNPDEPSFVKFGRASDKDPNLDIKAGQLKLKGTVVQTFFEPSIRSIKDAAMAIGFNSGVRIKSAFLVGGFAASDFLFSQVKKSLEDAGIEFSRPDTHVNKAVSDGAIGFYLNHCVTVRRSRRHYGAWCSTRYDPSNPDHVDRYAKHGFMSISGDKRVKNKFDVILSQGIRVSDKQEFRRSYTRVYEKFDRPTKHTVLEDEIIHYTGPDKLAPDWIDSDFKNFLVLCKIRAEPGMAFRNLTQEEKEEGGYYYKNSFDVVVTFGATELSAQFAWKEDGVEKRSAATVAYTTDSVVYADVE